MNNKLFLIINFWIYFFLNFQANAFVPKPIEIDESIFFDDILLEGIYKNWQYYPFEFEATGLKKIISIRNLNQIPILITTDTLKQKKIGVPSFFTICISHFYTLKNDFISLNTLKENILGRYALKFEITYEKYAEKNYITCTDHFFMLYKQSKNKRIRNLEYNKADKKDINFVLKEEDIDCSEMEDYNDDEDQELLKDKGHLKNNNGIFLSCFTFSWLDLFD